MNTKDVCKKLDITVKSLRIYEQYGIVIPKREENNYRNYSYDDLFKLKTAIERIRFFFERHRKTYR